MKNICQHAITPLCLVAGDSFPSYAARCGSCKGEPVSEVSCDWCRPGHVIMILTLIGPQVCGSDGKTYRNTCELQYISCKKYWDLRVVSKVGALQTS